MRFKFLNVLLVLAMLIPLAGCAQSSGTVKIGVIAPLTGDVKTFGESVKNGIELAVDQWNEKGGVAGKKVEIVLADDKNDPVESSAAATKLITQDGIKFLLGSVTSKCAIPVADVANTNKVLAMSPTATNPKLTVDPWPGGTRKEYVFRACFIDKFQADVMAQFATEDLQITKAAVLYDNGNDYVLGLAEFFKAAFEAAGGEVIAYEAYSKDDTDFSAILTKALADEPEMLYVPDYYNMVNLIAKQARDAGYEGVLAGADGWDSAELDYAATEGGYFTNHYSPEDPRPEVQSFVAGYQEQYGSVPDALGMLGYEGANLLLNAINEANSLDVEKVREALASTKDFASVSGELSFDDDGNPVKGIAVLQVSEGKQQAITTIRPQ